MEPTIFSFCSYSASYQHISVGGWKFISGATGDEAVKWRWIEHARSVWNNAVSQWKYCLWALGAHKDVALASSAEFEFDCKILKLHPKGRAWELFSTAGFRCSCCLHAAPSSLCPCMCRKEAWMQQWAALYCHVKLDAE